MGKWEIGWLSLVIGPWQMPFHFWTLNLFLRVSADTKTCGSPLKPASAGGFRLPAGKHTGILTEFQTKDKKKIKKGAFFGHQFCILNSLIPILCVLRHFKWVRNIKKIVDNTGANIVVLVYRSLGALWRKQRILEVPEKKAGRQYTFCFWARV